MHYSRESFYTCNFYTRIIFFLFLISIKYIIKL
nr:MAG TPA: hypothetical protein [Caudoviricetes sp.]